MRCRSARGERISRAVYANGRLSFEVRIAPSETWHCCLLYDLIDGNRHFHAPHDCAHQPSNAEDTPTGRRRC